MPRIGTPRNPDCQTYGPEVGEVARRLGTTLMPWQQYAADVAYEIDPDTGRLMYDEVVLTIMRQSGKTLLVFSKSVWRLTVVPHRLGRQRSMFTAQRRADARKKLERDFIPMLQESEEKTGSFVEITNAKGRPSKSTRQWKSSMNNGQEHLLFGRGNYLQIDAPTREAGHGDTLDDVTIDEAFAHQTDAVEEATGPARSTRPDSQQWTISTAGDEKSFFFWPKVRDGRRAVESGASSSVCYLEWSLPPEANIDDEAAWWEFMPALGRTIPVEYIRAQLEKARRSIDPDAEDKFRRGYCNQWPRIPMIEGAERESIIDPGAWRRCGVADDCQIIGPVAVGVDVSPNGSTTTIAVAGRNVHGRVQVEVAYYDPGTFWLQSRLADVLRRNPVVAVAYNSSGPARAMAPEIQRAVGELAVEILKLADAEWSAACSGFALAFNQEQASHVGQSWLNAALENATKKYRGIHWLWDRQTSFEDLSPLCAVTAAHRAIEMHRPKQEGAPNLW